ncbi:SMP-30/gluconolactonase/LRE family protein [Bauldia sp.]|uniref:SMP-30/gluconolactonase/LRE family protein n=1 Tax=Bauldia sp. TaxID=2575872 RepID=UPI003BAAFB55
MRAEIAVESGDNIGEGAFWHPGLNRLFWLDVPPPSKLHIYDPVTGARETHDMPQMIASMRPWGPGLLIAAHAGLYRYDLADRIFARVVAPEPDLPFNRCNDGGTDAEGRFWFGTMQNNISPSATDIDLTEKSGTLYRLDPDLTLNAVDRDILIANTLCFSPDNRTLYFCDTAEGAIRTYDYDLATGSATRRGALGSFDRGAPDGSCVDAEGGVWNARWDGGCVVRFAPDGSVDWVIEVAAPKVTSVAFGGADLDTLFITTARWGGEAGGVDGHLFVASPGVRGMPVTSFAGAWT